MQPADILILSNGPGEVTTWVHPVVKALRQKLGNDRSLIRISVILSPCPNATGKEAAIALSYLEVDRVQSSEHFFPFLLGGKTAANWDWREKGVVVFLGGDQFFPVVIGKRLGYRTVVYAEWEARWYQWIDRFGVMKPSVLSKIPPQYQSKFSVVGDLMADVEEQRSRGAEEQGSRGAGEQRSREVEEQENETRRQGNRVQPSTFNFQPATELIGLLPGSKSAKLAQGVPLCLAIAQEIAAQHPQTRFIIPVAPTLDVQTLARFANRSTNPVIDKMGGVSAQLLPDCQSPQLLKTDQGLEVTLVTQFPAAEILRQCSLVLTTVGANTAQLGALAVPMIVLLPTQQLDAMRAWDGIPGILANLPFVGSLFAKTINWFVLKQRRLFAWPNIWANEEIVPELVGNLKVADVAKMVLDYLENPQKLQQMRDRLVKVRGLPGAAQAIAELVDEQLEFNVKMRSQ